MCIRDRLYGVDPQKGVIAPGSDADIVVWNPDTEWTMSVENLSLIHI